MGGGFEGLEGGGGGEGGEEGGGVGFDAEGGGRGGLGLGLGEGLFGFVRVWRGKERVPDGCVGRVGVGGRDREEGGVPAGERGGWLVAHG